MQLLGGKVLPLLWKNLTTQLPSRAASLSDPSPLLRQPLSPKTTLIQHKLQQGMIYYGSRTLHTSAHLFLEWDLNSFFFFFSSLASEMCERGLYQDKGEVQKMEKKSIRRSFGLYTIGDLTRNKVLGFSVYEISFDDSKNTSGEISRN